MLGTQKIALKFTYPMTLYMQLRFCDYSFFEVEGNTRTEAYFISTVEVWWNMFFINFLSQSRT